jgi:hypothetical protein
MDSQVKAVLDVLPELKEVAEEVARAAKQRGIGLPEAALALAVEQRSKERLDANGKLPADHVCDCTNGSEHWFMTRRGLCR